MAEERTITIPLRDLLDFICVTRESPVVPHSSIAEWLGDLTDAEIKKYAKWFTSREGRDAGYDDEDREHAVRNLMTWRHRYFPDYVDNFAKKNNLEGENNDDIIDEMVEKILGY